MPTHGRRSRARPSPPPETRQRRRPRWIAALRSRRARQIASAIGRPSTPKTALARDHGLPGRCGTIALGEERSRVVAGRSRVVAGRSRVVAGRSRVVAGRSRRLTKVSEALGGNPAACWTSSVGSPPRARHEARPPRRARGLPAAGRRTPVEPGRPDGADRKWPPHSSGPGAREPHRDIARGDVESHPPRPGSSRRSASSSASAARSRMTSSGSRTFTTRHPQRSSSS